MSNNFEAPKLKKLDNAVAAQEAAEEKMDKSTKVPTERVVTDPVDIYKNGIDEFTKFLAGEIHAGNLEQRNKFQLDFFDNMFAMLKLDEDRLKSCLDYFVIQVVQNRHLYTDGTIVAPLYHVEPKRPAADVLKYKRFMLFLITFAEYAKDRPRFLANYDVVKFASMFSPEIKQKLTNYVYR